MKGSLSGSSYLSIGLDESPALAGVDLAAAVGAQFDPEIGSLGCIFIFEINELIPGVNIEMRAFEQKSLKHFKQVLGSVTTLTRPPGLG